MLCWNTSMEKCKLYSQGNRLQFISSYSQGRTLHDFHPMCQKTQSSKCDVNASGEWEKAAMGVDLVWIALREFTQFNLHVRTHFPQFFLRGSSFFLKIPDFLPPDTWEILKIFLHFKMFIRSKSCWLNKQRTCSSPGSAAEQMNAWSKLLHLSRPQYPYLQKRAHWTNYTSAHSIDCVQILRALHTCTNSSQQLCEIGNIFSSPLYRWGNWGMGWLE